MNNHSPLLSICIPTNGVMEWVFPVLESIFSQGVDESLYEVVVTDNGNNEQFYAKMSEFAELHSNINYVRTDAFEFLNEIESYKLAKGKFIKFINHRTKLLTGTLNYFIKFVEENIETKPGVYFSNGMLGNNSVLTYESFDGYVVGLSYWSSCSTGMGFWKEDFLKISENQEYNTLFPHTTILFAEKNKTKYIIDDKELLFEMPVGKILKGRYNLFYAFAVEYVAILLDLYRNNSISKEDFIYLKNKNLEFIAKLYFDFIIRKKKCSYDLSGTDESIKVFYSKSMIKKKVRSLVLSKLFHVKRKT